MSAIFPSAIATSLQMLLAINNTKVTLNVAAGIGDTTLTVDDPSALSTSGYLTFDDNEASPETISYTGKSGTDLTGVTRAADGTSAGTHSVGAHLEMRWNAAYHNTLATEIIAVEQNLSDRIGVDSGSHVLKVTAGAVGAPALEFSGDTNTGLYSVGADILGLATGGVLAVTVNASQQLTILKTTNQIVLGTTTTTTISGAAPASSAVYTIPDVGTTANFVMTAGTQTIGGAKTWSAAGIFQSTLEVDGVVTLPLTSNQIVLGTTRTITISAVTPASSSRTWTIPDITGNGTFAALEGTQTFSGAKTHSATLTMSGATIAMGTNKITGLAAGTTAGDALRYEQLFVAGTVTLLGSLAFNPTTGGIIGTTTNDSVATGTVGEYVTATVGATNCPTSGQYGDLTSISLTAGDWQISGSGFFSINGSTWSSVQLGISTTTGNSATGLTNGDTLLINSWLSSAVTPTVLSVTIAPLRVSLSGTTTYYLKYLSSFTGGPPTALGRLSARRVR